jgi:hypothetical protein
LGYDTTQANTQPCDPLLLVIIIIIIIIIMIIIIIINMLMPVLKNMLLNYSLWDTARRR